MNIERKRCHCTQSGHQHILFFHIFKMHNGMADHSYVSIWSEPIYTWRNKPWNKRQQNNKFVGCWVVVCKCWRTVLSFFFCRSRASLKCCAPVEQGLYKWDGSCRPKFLIKLRYRSERFIFAFIRIPARHDMWRVVGFSLSSFFRFFALFICRFCCCCFLHFIYSSCYRFQNASCFCLLVN